MAEIEEKMQMDLAYRLNDFKINKRAYGIRFALMEDLGNFVTRLQNGVLRVADVIDLYFNLGVESNPKRILHELDNQPINGESLSFGENRRSL